MNQESFLKYREQVYNPGSPNPNPSISPLKILPKDLESPYRSTPDPENPLKITLSCKRKRTNELESSPNNKKPKMATKEEIEEMNEKLLKRFLDAQATSSRELCDEFKKEIKEEIGGIKLKIDNLNDKQEAAAVEKKKEKEDNEARFKALEDKIEAIQSQNNAKNTEGYEDRIESAVQNYVDINSDSSWKANLAREVFDHDHGLVVHGIRIDGRDDAARRNAVRKFVKEEMKASDDLLNRIKIKDVIRLGADNGEGKPPPILIKLGHPTERNLLLPLSRNLKNGIDIDKNIPKMYLQKHKEFKRLAWKLKTVHDVQAQVIFDSHNLVLRYKKKDNGPIKYNWTIEKEFYPKPGDASTSLNRASARDPDKVDTPIIDTTNTAECNQTIIVTGVCDTIDKNNVSAEFMTYFDSKDHEHLVKIDLKYKGTTVITCRDWKGCKHIKDSYSGKKFLGKDIYFTLFREENPDL